jgi:hypothetical protein
MPSGSKQSGRDSQPLAHPQRELADPLARDIAQPDPLDQLVDAGLRDAVRLRERKQVVARRASGMNRARLEQRPYLVERGLKVAVGLPVHGHRSRGRAVEAEDQAHRRRLARAVGAEKAGHDPGKDREGQVVHGPFVAVLLREPVRLDQKMTPFSVPGSDDTRPSLRGT